MQRGASSGTLLWVWTALVTLGFCAALASTAPLAWHVERARASDYRSYLAAAGAAADRGETLEALKQLSKVRELAPPRDSEALRLTGDVYYRLRKWDEAVAAYEAATDAGSRDLGTYLNLVWAFVEKGEFERAVETGRRADALGLDSPALSRSMGEALRRSGRIAESIPHYERALVAFSDNMYLMEMLCQAYRATGDVKRAEAMAERMDEVQAEIGTLLSSAPAAGE